MQTQHLHGTSLGLLRQSERRHVQCADCGYLSIREKDSQAFVGVDEGYRESGKAHQPKGHMREVMPLCFVGAHDLEVKPTTCDVIRDKICKERKCDCFTKWLPAFSPREHYDMNMIQEQRQYQEKRLDEDRKWRAGESQTTEDRHANIMRQSEDQHRIAMKQNEEQHQVSLRQAAKHHWRHLLVFGVLVTIALVVTQIVTALISRSSEPQHIIIEQPSLPAEAGDVDAPDGE